MSDEVTRKLEEAGFETYLVGGCVRDELLARDNFDIDITTTARPEQILEVFKSYKTIDIGKKFGTIKVLLNLREYEITTMRKENAYDDKRHPSLVYYTDDIYEDLKRRDFTINAMAKRKGSLIDPFNGKDEL